MKITESSTKTLNTIPLKNTHKEWDSTFQLMSWWKKDIIKQAKVMVVGAGALGNEVVKNLVLLNVGHILIVDFDTIEYANLNRSVLFREADCGLKKGEAMIQRAREINPEVKMQYIDGNIRSDVGLGIFREMDVIIGCLDNRLARLFLNRACYKLEKIWIDAAIENLAGQVKVYKPYKACYECDLTAKDKELINFKLGCVDIAKRNESQGRIPTTPISSSIMAAIQVQEALKVIHQNDENLMDDHYLYYEGMNNIIMQLDNKPLKEECGSHFVYEDILPSPISADWTIAETLAWLKEAFQDEDPMINLDYQLILKLTTKDTEHSTKMILPAFRLTEEIMVSLRKKPGEAIVISDSVYQIDTGFSEPAYTLAAIGIPPFQILRVWAAGKEKYVELSGDRNFLSF